jgi:tRNA threonylcarbamoyladenosine biosynthesis protein TsaB
MTDGITLALDGSTYAGSCAVIRGSEVLGHASLPQADKPGRSGREEHFMPMVAQCLMEAGIRPNQLARVVCGAGPGSFTSLRVAASIAKGLAVGAGVKLYAVSSLGLIVASSDAGNGRWLALLPAMRDEFFAGLFDVSEKGIREIQPARIIAASSADEEAAAAGARIVGLVGKNPVTPHARGVARILEDVIADGECDIASWEPLYGRLAEAQARWEAAHGRPLTAAG